MLNIPNRPERIGVPCLTDVVEQEGQYKKGDNAAELLRPLFERVFDRVQRPL